MKRQTALSVLVSAPILVPQLARGAEKTLRVATLPVDASAAVYYAQDMGFLKDAGLEVQVIPSGSGATIPAAIAQGALDIGWSNVMSLAAAYKRGVPLSIIAAGGTYVKGLVTSALLVPRDSALRTARDLNGKVIACNGLANLGQFATQNWIDKNGGDSATVKFIELSFPEMPVALAQHRIDAAFVGEPYIDQAKDARIFSAPLDIVYPRVMLGCWFTTPAWAKANRSSVASFLAAMTKTATWANAHQDESGAILSKYGKVDPAIIKSMHRVAYGARVDTREVQALVDIAAKYGGMGAAFPADDIIFRP